MKSELRGKHYREFLRFKFFLLNIELMFNILLTAKYFTFIIQKTLFYIYSKDHDRDE